MSKLFDLLEILKEQEGIEMLVAHCEVVVKEVEKELEKDPKSDELKAISRGYNSDKEILETRLTTLRDRFANLFCRSYCRWKFFKRSWSFKNSKWLQKSVWNIKGKNVITSRCRNNTRIKLDSKRVFFCCKKFILFIIGVFA